MSKPTLKVFSDTSHSRRELELDRLTGVADAKQVSLPVSKILPLLIDAAESDRAWLTDFADDLIHIDADLYEVLMAYQQYRERAAA